jgi:hypothetical protein
MSEQGTEKTNPLHGLEQDGTGTGTGVWAHPAAEPRQPEQQRCECECECGQCWFDGRVWAWRGVGTQKKICIANSTLPGHCPGSCGCRLSVVAGEPRVGEKYADLERDAKRFRAVADDAPQQIERIPCDVGDIFSRWSFETSRIYTRYATLGEYADALLGGE